MCHGPYVPPIFIPIGYVINAFANFGKGLKNMDEAIRANNLKLIQFVKEKNNTASNQLEEKSTISIEEIKTQLVSMNEQDREELAKLLIQRCTARLEQQSYSLAKEDLVEALSLMKSEEEQQASINNNDDKQSSSNYSSFSKNFYLAEYLLGVCCFGKGEYKEAAQHYQKSIEHREDVEAQLVDCENADKELQDLEEQFFSMQLKAKKPIDKVVASWTRSWTNYSTSVTNFTNKAKNYCNHQLMLGTHKPVLLTKPKTLITLEMLYIRAGVSYYSGTYYSNAIPYFNRAIELGESYQSEYVESTYYNRGLCYYYLGELQLAIDDFTKSISLMPLLKQRDVVYTMRACTYGRLGMDKEKKQDENKAFYVNPFTKPVPLFHLRLLNDDVLSHMMTFLQTNQILVMSSLNRYTRDLVKKHLQENDIEISRTSLLSSSNNGRSYKASTIAQDLFLPRKEQKYTTLRLNEMLEHPLLVNHAKNLIVYPSSYYDSNYSFEKDAMLHFEHLKRLTINDCSEIQKILRKHSPNLEFLEVGSVNIPMNELAYMISSLHKLKHLILPVVFFSVDPFPSCNELQIVEYTPITDRDIEQYKPNSKWKTWKQLQEMHPNIIFKERTTPARLFTTDGSNSSNDGSKLIILY